MITAGTVTSAKNLVKILIASVSPPGFWPKNYALSTQIDIPPHTACTWCYEQMYSDEIRAEDNSKRQYDYDKRRKAAENYFAQFEAGKSLIFYYAGYSNPFSENEENNYVVVGVSRLKELSSILFYDEASAQAKQQYGGAFIWQMPVTSNYPHEGFCIPYQKYMGDEDALNKIVVKPLNSAPFKYGSREVSNDDAIEIINQLITCVDALLISDYISLTTYDTMKNFVADVRAFLNGADNVIAKKFSASKIDNGVVPSTEYEINNLLDVDSAERFRAFCVDELKKIPAHSFVKAATILNAVNLRLERLPDWKKSLFQMQNFSVDKDILDGALVQRKDGDDKLYLYLKETYEDERTIENALAILADRPDIQPKLAITPDKFKNSLKDTDSPLERNCPQEYEKILDTQAAICMKIFTKPLCVISGHAGTGKTTVIRAILDNIARVHGVGTSFLLLAPGFWNRQKFLFRRSNKLSTLKN